MLIKFFFSILKVSFQIVIIIFIKKIEVLNNLLVLLIKD